MARTSTGSRGSKEWESVRRWTRVEAQAAIDALEASGEPVARFAARHGVDTQRLYSWRRRLRALALPSVPAFVEINTTTAALASEAFEVVLQTGEVVRVPTRFDDGALRRLLSIVRAERPC